MKETVAAEFPGFSTSLRAFKPHGAPAGQATRGMRFKNSVIHRLIVLKAAK